jgi:hypothetical protein
METISHDCPESAVARSFFANHSDLPWKSAASPPRGVYISAINHVDAGSEDRHDH